MKMKKITLFALSALALSTVSCKAQTSTSKEEKATSVVYVTREITPESLLKIYKAVGRKAEGRVAVKISTGESEETGYLRPAFIKPLLDEVHGTIVECNTAYPGARSTSEQHWKTIKERGFLDVAKVDIMDEEGEMKIPVTDTTYMKYNIVGSHLQNYDFMINLAHYKGHRMGGMGGVIKNASIGVASAGGKAYIHTSGYTTDTREMWSHFENQDGFVECMANAAQAVHNFFGNGEKILYISVMNKMSIDCDCNAHPAAPLIADYGIIASTDPVALDQAAFDIINQIHNDAHNNTKPLLDRIAQQHGMHAVEHGEKIGLGSRTYTIVNIDK